MYPSKKDYSNLSNLNSIIPGINGIYNETKNNNEKITYSFKSFEIFKKLMNN